MHFIQLKQTSRKYGESISLLYSHSFLRVQLQSFRYATNTRRTLCHSVVGVENFHSKLPAPNSSYLHLACAMTWQLPHKWHRTSTSALICSYLFMQTLLPSGYASVTEQKLVLPKNSSNCLITPKQAWDLSNLSNNCELARITHLQVIWHKHKIKIK